MTLMCFSIHSLSSLERLYKRLEGRGATGNSSIEQSYRLEGVKDRALDLLKTCHRLRVKVLRKGFSEAEVLAKAEFSS